MKMRSRRWLAPTSAALNIPNVGSPPSPATRYPRDSRSWRTDLSPRLMCPGTFSKKHQEGATTLMRSRILGQRCLGSFSARPFPARLNGWQGYPPTMPSTFPRQGPPLKVLRFVQIGASSKASSSMREARTWAAYASCSTQQTTREDGSATLMPTSSCPVPEQTDRILEERRSTLYLPFQYFTVDIETRNHLARDLVDHPLRASAARRIRCPALNFLFPAPVHLALPREIMSWVFFLFVPA